ncbi:MAG: RluA family pseudouridine synthase [Oscillospiraceae bacterium]|nr:RluA family pseudouridine synthase [Oscillospiraceae bacterium]
MEILYQDRDIIVFLKPPGVVSVDEEGGVPELLRQELRQPDAVIRTVHRLDRVVGGLMVVARSSRMAEELSRQIRGREFRKEYLTVVHGDPGEAGTLRDLMGRDKARRMSYVTDTPGKGVQEAVLHFRRLGTADGLSLLRIELETGRTHQIRCQFSAHGWELAGERKYSTRGDSWPLALWSCRLAFRHPFRGDPLDFEAMPPRAEPWLRFAQITGPVQEAGR